MNACRIKPEWDLSSNGTRLIDWNRLRRGHEYSEDCPECSSAKTIPQYIDTSKEIAG